MTKTKPLPHTPGPWMVGTDTARGASNGRSHVLAQHPLGPLMLVADCRGHEGNARLIAAAPELVEALERVRHAFYVDGSSKALRAAFEGTKELVAKAKGT